MTVRIRIIENLYFFAKIVFMTIHKKLRSMSFRKIHMMKDVCKSLETTHFWKKNVALFQISSPDSLRVKKKMSNRLGFI